MVMNVLRIIYCQHNLRIMTDIKYLFLFYFFLYNARCKSKGKGMCKFSLRYFREKINIVVAVCIYIVEIGNNM